MRIVVATIVITVCVLARAQPAPDPGAGSDAGSDAPSPAPTPSPPAPRATPPVDPYPERAGPRSGHDPTAPIKRDPPIDMPTVLLSPTGWLLPAAVLYARTAIDTGSDVTVDGRVGLGDVAEFGVATTDE